MVTTKLVEKMEKFFDLSEMKQRRKHDKYLKIVLQLEKRKFKLEQKVKKGRADANSRRYKDLMRELQVLTKLISKAKQQELSD